MKILFLAPYPVGRAPNQRFRFEQYLDHLEQSGISYEYHTFWSERVWNIFYAPNHFGEKLAGLISGLIRRYSLLFQIRKFDFVFVHRECTPVGPPVMEFLIARLFRKKMIFDYDDAIWIRNYSKANKGIARFLKSHQKVAAICRYSYKISTGNNFLGDYARQFNNNVSVIPTTIDTANHHNRLKEIKPDGPLVIGWTGTHSTLAQLAEIEVELAELHSRVKFDLHVICDTDPAFKNIPYTFVPWTSEREIEDLLMFDVGIMPLKNTDWERGKCGFKALQYMALGIPVVASAVGANEDIIQHEKNGFLIKPDNKKAWISTLQYLFENPDVRGKVGKAGRDTIVDHYSVESNKEKYLQLFS